MRVRAAVAAQHDPNYRTVVEAVCASTLLAHVRLASVGGVSERNTHPFAHGPWLFAHNGTLQGFSEEPVRLRRLIPEASLRHIQGDTDSEHLFHYLLACLKPLSDSADREANADRVAEIVCEALCALVDLFPGSEADPTQLNLVLTNGETLIATRWGHTLFWLTRRGPAVVDMPVEPSPAYHVIAIASEPTTTESAWTEVPDRSVLLIRPDLSHALMPITRSAR